MHRNEERSSLHQFLVVEISGMNPRRRAVDAAVRFGRRHAQAAEERPQRNLYGIAEVSQHAVPIERNYFGSSEREIVGKKSCARSKTVIRKRRGELELKNAKLQYVPGLGSLHVNGPGENMTTRTTVGHLFVDSAQRIRDLIAALSGRLQARRIP